MKKIIDVFKDKKLYIFLGIVLLFFGIFIRPHFSVDTYQLGAMENMSYTKIYKEDGRIILFLLMNMFGFLRMNIYGIHIAVVILSIIFETLALYFLDKTLSNYIKNPLLSAVASVLIIINPLTIELWLFTEMVVMELSILFSVVAFWNFNKYIEAKKKKNVLYAVVCMLISIFSYQGTISIFIALCSLVIIKNSKNIKDFLRNNIVLGICYVIPAISNLIAAKILGTSRLSASHNILENFRFIAGPAMGAIFNVFWILPSRVFITFFVISIIISIFAIVSNKEDNDKKGMLFFGIFYIVVMTIFFTVIPMFAQEVDKISLFPRSTYAIGGIIGLIITYSLMNYNKDSKGLTRIIMGTSIVLLSIQYICFSNIATDRYIVNYMDEYIILEIDEKISEYENSTGIKVKNISFYNLENSNKYYIKLKDKLNVSARSEKMSGTYIIKHYTGRNLNIVDQNEEIYEKYFKDRSWEMFNLEQVVIEGDTVNIFVF